MAEVRRSLGDSSDELSEGGCSTQSGGARRSVICYTERGVAYPAKLSLSEESEEDSSISDRNSQIQTPSRHQSSEFDENEEFSLRTRSSSTNEEDSAATLLAELESIPQIASRYTEGDTEYAQEFAARIVPPPVITQWAGRSRHQFQGGRGRGRGGGGNYEDRNKRRFDSNEDDDGRGAKSSRGYGGYYNNHRGGGGGRGHSGYGQQQRYGQSQGGYSNSAGSSSQSHSGNSGPGHDQTW